MLAWRFSIYACYNLFGRGSRITLQATIKQLTYITITNHLSRKYQALSKVTCKALDQNSGVLNKYLVLDNMGHSTSNI